MRTKSGKTQMDRSEESRYRIMESAKTRLITLTATPIKAKTRIFDCEKKAGTPINTPRKPIKASNKTNDPISIGSTSSETSESTIAINKESRLKPAKNKDMTPKTECWLVRLKAIYRH